MQTHDEPPEGSTVTVARTLNSAPLRQVLLGAEDVTVTGTFLDYPVPLTYSAKDVEALEARVDEAILEGLADAPELGALIKAVREWANLEEERTRELKQMLAKRQARQPTAKV